MRSATFHLLRGFNLQTRPLLSSIFRPALRPFPFACFLLGLAFSSAVAKEKRTFPEGEVITLEQAYDRALETDQSIRIAYHETRKANLLPWSALTRLGPQVSAGVSYARSERAFRSTVTETTVSGVETLARQVERTSHSRSGVSDLGFSVQQPLIDFTVFAAYRGAKLSAEATRLQQRYTVRGVLYGVATAYYDVLRQQRLVYVNRETFRLAGEQLDLAQKRADVGEVTRSDVLRAKVIVETARRDVVESENTLAYNRNTLTNILNVPHDTRFQVSEPPGYPTSLPIFESLLQRAYAQREDLRVQDLAIEQEIARRGEIIGQYGPRVVAQFDGGIANATGTSSNNTRDWQAAVSVQVPIFTGGQREIDLKNAAENIAQARLSREQTAKSVEQDVKLAWLTVRSLEETLKALRAQVEAADQGYEDLQNQYRAGTATSVDVLSALNDLNTARKDLALQTYDYQVALRNLEQVSGVFQESRVQRLKFR